MKRRWKLINAPAAGASAEVNDLSSVVTWANVPDANITESSVTQHEAALTILETQITDGALLARVADNETITGTWTFNENVTLSTADLLPATALTNEVGTGTLPFDSMFARQGNFVHNVNNNATISFSNAYYAGTQGGLIAGTATGFSGSTAQMTVYGYYPPIGIMGNVFTGAVGHTATMYNRGGGSMLFGSSFVGGSSGTGTARMYVHPYSYGSFTGGYAFSNGGNSSAIVNNYGAGSFVWGYPAPGGTGTGTIESTGAGAFVVGRITGNNQTHGIRGAGIGSFTQGLVLGNSNATYLGASGNGSFAQGRSNNGSRIIATANGSFAQGSAASSGGYLESSGAGAFAQGSQSQTSTLESTGQGSFAQGRVRDAGSYIQASNNGSFAQGYSQNGYVIGSSGLGSFAQGDNSAGNILATVSNAVQFGPGTNGTANSLQIGSGILLEASGSLTFDGGTQTFALSHTDAATNFTGTGTHLNLILGGGGDLRVRTGTGLSIWDSTNTDNARFSHDGTDFNTVFTTTTDWNISGLTSIQAGTVDADFDAITATSYGGITESNLLDKSASETITAAAWTWNVASNAITTLSVGEASTLRGDAQDSRIILYGEQTSVINSATIQNSGSNLQFNVTSGLDVQWLGDGSWNFDLRDGANLIIRDSSDTAFVTFAHDGTDLNITETGTSFIRFPSGPNLLNLDMENNLLVEPILRNYAMQHASNGIVANAATITFDTNVQTLDLASATGNVTVTLSGGPTSSGNYGEIVLRVIQDTTARTITWAGGTFLWPGGTQPTLSAGSTAEDVFHFWTIDSGTTWYGTRLGADFQ